MRRLVAVAGALAVLTSVSACSDDDAGPRATTTTSAPATTSRPAPAAPATANLAAIDVRLERVATLRQPLALALRPGHSPFYVAEKGGRVQVVRPGAAPATLLDLSTEVSTGGEQGLLGLAFSPDGSLAYVDYTDRDGDTRLVEYRLGAGDTDIDLASRRLVLSVDQPAPNHNGGNLVFGPDGLLWFGLGDGGGAGDQYGNAQNPDTLLGSILRIDPRPSGGQPYRSPPDNPYAGGGGRPEIALIGLRNPWRFSFDRRTNDLWIGDVGQGQTEEVDLLPAGRQLGANLGWPAFEGTRPYRGTPPRGAVPPVFEYDHDEGQAIVGGYVYRGSAVPAMQGAYLFADTYTARLRALAFAGGRVTGHRDLGVNVPGGLVSSFGEDAGGELYVLSLSGGLYRLEAG